MHRSVFSLACLAVTAGASFSKAAAATRAVLLAQAAPLPYTGRGADVAAYLLQHATGWTLGGDRPSPPSRPPAQCQRDSYVFAATLAAWAANAEVASGHPERAGEMIDQMYTNLRNARNLCSDVPPSGGTGCATDWLTCEWLAAHVPD